PRLRLVVWLFLSMLTAVVIAWHVLPVDDSQSAANVSQPGPIIEQITLSAPPIVTAGTPFTVTIRSRPALDQAEVALYLFNTDGTRRFAQVLHQGQAHVPIAVAATEVAGAVELVAQSGAATGRLQLTIVPGEPVEPLVALAGPRSITADGKHWTMVTALPHDRFGNAVAEGTLVTVRVLHPVAATATDVELMDGVELLTAQTQHLLAWIRVFSRTVAGRMEMAATAGAAHSPERTVLAVPGAPAPFAIHNEPSRRVADGRRLVTVYTDSLQDRFGNVLLDGTAVTFIVTDPDGTTRTLLAQIIDGKAAVQLQSPAIPGQIHVEALVHNTTSSPLSLDFAAGIGTTPIVVRAVPGTEVLTLIAGPLLGPLDQYIPDGSEVHFTLRPAGKVNATVEVTAPASAGFATAVLRISTLPAARYQVLVSAGVGQGETMVELGDN
ncbi:MAG: hypothetical protein KDE53_18380, partial [Caldilineaceae bacterium]|nr:hypothetical protein [Caldilineaceae bacterium]